MRRYHNSLKTATLVIVGPLVAAPLASYSVTDAGAGERIQIAQTALNKSSSKWHVADPIEVELDVDTAYLRLKREFNFNTIEERLANTHTTGDTGGRDALLSDLYNAGFAFEGQTGVYYLMRDRTTETDRIIQVQVSKNGSGSRIDFAFVTAQLVSVPQYRDQLRQRILKSVEN